MTHYRRTYDNIALGFIIARHLVDVSRSFCALGWIELLTQHTQKSGMALAGQGPLSAPSIEPLVHNNGNNSRSSHQPAACASPVPSGPFAETMASAKGPVEKAFLEPSASLAGVLLRCSVESSPPPLWHASNRIPVSIECRVHDSNACLWLVS